MSGEAGGSGGTTSYGNFLTDGGGGGGGAGGYGAIVTGSGINSNTSTITGGQGGDGGLSGLGNGGSGGDGGVGVQFTASNATLTNAGTITGGDGGAAGGVANSANGTSPGATGEGGTAIVGAGLTVVNSGTITGGLSGDGTTRADAIDFTGGTNSLTITATSTITGNVVASSAADIFGLGGSTNATFDMSQLGAAGSTVQYQGFGNVVKTGTSDWTITGTPGTPLNTTIAEGVLTLGSAGALSTTAGTISFTGGTLQYSAANQADYSARFSTAANQLYSIDTNGRDVTFATALTSSGGNLTVADSSAAQAGVLVLSAVNTYSGGTTVLSGTLALDHATGGNIDAAGSGSITLSNGSLVASISGTLTNQLVVSSGTVDTLAAANGTTLTYVGSSSARTAFLGNLHIGTSANQGVVALDEAVGTTYSTSGTLSVDYGTLLRANGSLGLTLSQLASVSVNNSATFNLNDFSATLGNLQGTSAAATILLGTAETTTLTLNAGSFAGSIDGSGGLTIASGTTALSGTSLYTGPTTIQSRLDLTGSGSIASSSQVLLATGGTFDISGLTNGGTSIVSLGNTTVDQSGTVALGGNQLTLTGADSAFGGVISGAGGLTLSSGSETLTGANTYTGATTISGGTLEVDGSIASNDVVVNSGGTLSGTGKLGDPTIQAGGTLAPGSAANPTGTLTIVGPLTFQAGSFYTVNLTPTANSRTNVTGTTTIGGGTVNVLAGAGTYAPTRYTLLTATGGVTGRFAALNATTNLAFLNPTLGYDADDVYLNLTRTVTLAGQVVTFPTVAATPNQRAAAAGIESIGGGALFNAVLNQTAAGARAAFDAASGEIHASAVTAGIEDSRFPREAIFDRLEEVSRPPVGAPGALTPFGAVAALPPGAQGYAPVHKGYDIPVAAPVPAPAPYTVWGTGFGDFGRNGGNGNAATLDRTLGGFVLGADARVDASYFTNWRIGVAGGYTSDDLRVNARQSTGTFETYFGGLYAGAQYGAIDIKLGALGGGTNTDTQRTIAFPGFLDTARSSSNGTIVQGFGEVGYKVGLAAGFIEPIVQGAVIHLGQDGYRETGGAAALLGFGRDYDVETLTAGARAETALPFAGLPIIARAFLGYRHAFGDVDPRVTQAFLAGGTAFTVAGAPIDRDAVYAEAGLDYRATSNLTLGVKYSGQAGERAYDNAVKGSLEYKF